MSSTKELQDRQAAPPAPRLSGTRARLVAFALVTVVCAVAALVYVSQHSDEPPAADASAIAGVLAGPHVLLLEGESDATRPRSVVAAPLDQPDRPLTTALHCQRVHYAGGKGLCLTLGYDPAEGSAYIFDSQLGFVSKVPAQGLPSRARVSPDGLYAAMTFFVFGHSYADGTFSTATQIVDLQTGDLVGNLEDLTTYRNGEVIKDDDFNFWGVTFETGGGFYATLGTGGETYLVHGDVAARRMDVVADDVECPSLSPDGKTIVFKQRVADSDTVEWRLWAMDVATMERRELTETRNVDDQVEWDDATHILYSPETIVPSVWTLDVTTPAPPALFADGVVSPAVVR